MQSVRDTPAKNAQKSNQNGKDSKPSTPRSKGQESFKKQEKTPKTPKGPSSVEDIKAKMQASIEKVSKIIFLKLSGDSNTTVSHFLILIYLPFCGVKFSQKWLTSL